MFAEINKQMWAAAYRASGLVPPDERGPLPAYTTRTSDHHHRMHWPNRCEYPGCHSVAMGDPCLKTCAGCRMVRYCSPEHQRADWRGAHKDECKLYQKLGLRAQFYTDEQMLERYPLRGARRLDNPKDKCDVCGLVESEANTMVLKCCGVTVCNTSQDYVIGSYTRDICPRSHQRYTLCGKHVRDEGHDTSKDWRECRACLIDILHQHKGSAWTMHLWEALNGWNMAPMLARHVPKHGLCATCSQCGNKTVMSVEGASFKSSNGDLLCVQCYPNGSNQYGQGPMFSTLPYM